MVHIIKNVDQLQCILNHQHTRILFPIKNSNHKSTVLTSMFRDCVFQQINGNNTHNFSLQKFVLI